MKQLDCFCGALWRYSTIRAVWLLIRYCIVRRLRLFQLATNAGTSGLRYSRHSLSTAPRSRNPDPSTRTRKERNRVCRASLWQ